MNTDKNKSNHIDQIEWICSYISKYVNKSWCNCWITCESFVVEIKSKSSLKRFLNRNEII